MLIITLFTAILEYSSTDIVTLFTLATKGYKILFIISQSM